MKPHILFVSRSLQPTPGGMQLYAFSLIEGLRSRQDVDITVCGFHGVKALLPFFIVLAFIRCLCWRGTHVHLGDAALSPILPLLRLLRPGLRCSVTVYGLDLTYRHALYQRLIRRSLPAGHCIVAISNATADAAVRLGVPRSSVVVIPCGIALPPVASSSVRDSSTILILGRQIPRKGTRWFLRSVLPKLQTYFPDIHVIVAGEGPEMPGILSDITELGFADSVSVAGRISEIEKVRLFTAATLFIMPNVVVDGDMEGFGLVAVEAAARGLPVVAADIEGITDAVIPDVTGLFFASGNVQGCIDCIKNAMQKEWHPKAMNDACRQYFSTETMTSSYIDRVFR